MEVTSALQDPLILFLLAILGIMYFWKLFERTLSFAATPPSWAEEIPHHWQPPGDAQFRGMGEVRRMVERVQYVLRCSVPRFDRHIEVGPD